MYEFVNTQQPQNSKVNKVSFISSLGDESVPNSSKTQTKGLQSAMGSRKDLG